MKTVILSESQVKNVIDRILTEQNEIRTEALTVNFDAVWGMGMWKLTSQQSGPIVQKLIGITDFINKNKGSVVTIQIEAGESQVTNVDNEDPSKPKLQPGVLSQRRGEQMVNFLTQYFQGLVSKGAIDKMPELPAPITKIGTTSYKQGSSDLKTKKDLYQQEQFVRAIITAKKDYECLVGMEITIGYFPGQSKSQHSCDEAIFELRMNGVSLGEVNLNNDKLDSLSSKIPTTSTRYETLQQTLRPASTRNGYKSVDEYITAIISINKSFASYGRKSDGKTGGARSQTFVLDGAKAKAIIDSAPTDKITLSIVPLVNENSKYKLFYTRGSHADTPWVTIKSKKSEDPLYNGEPNVGMSRGSSKETVLLQTDLCGNPIRTQKK
jgi:hypothetical protein